MPISQPWQPILDLASPCPSSPRKTAGSPDSGRASPGAPSFPGCSCLGSMGRAGNAVWQVPCRKQLLRGGARKGAEESDEVSIPPLPAKPRHTRAEPALDPNRGQESRFFGGARPCAGLDSGSGVTFFRGNHRPPVQAGGGLCRPHKSRETKSVAPSEAGVQGLSWAREPAPDSIRGRWIPACAGMTLQGLDGLFLSSGDNR